ncbi:MAG: hypothetical protein ACPG7F_09565, partial [Aggregatilineales bacterium]
LRMTLLSPQDLYFFDTPSLLINLNYLTFVATGSGEGLDPVIREERSLREYAPYPLYVIGRMYSVLGGLITVAAAFATARLLSGRYASIAAGLFTAVAFQLVQYAHYATTTSLSSGLTMLCIFMALKSLKSKDDTAFVRYLIGSVICAGLATGARYNAGVILGVPLLVNLIRLLQKRRYIFLFLPGLMIALFGVTFIITTPGSITNTGKFIEGINFITGQYLSGEGMSPWLGLFYEWQYLAVFSLGLPLTALIFAGCYNIVYQQPRDTQLAYVVIITYLLVYSLLILRTIRPAGADQLLVPIITPCAIIGAAGLTAVARRFIWTRITGLLLCIILPLSFSLQFVYQLEQTDTREHMQAWVYNTIPEQHRILLVGPYNVALDDEHYTTAQSFSMEITDATLKNYDYMILSDALPQFRARLIPGTYYIAPLVLQTPVASIERPLWAGYDSPLHTASYWHNPSIYIYCLHQDACDALKRTS